MKIKFGDRKKVFTFAAPYKKESLVKHTKSNSWNPLKGSTYLPFFENIEDSKKQSKYPIKLTL